MPLTTLNSVVLPAPFGPITPWIWPRSTASETPSRTTMPPKRLASASTASKRRAHLDVAPAAAGAGADRPSAPRPHHAWSQGGAWNLAAAYSSGQITVALPSISWTIGKKNPFMNGPTSTSFGASAFSFASLGNL